MRPFVHPPASSHWLRSFYLRPPPPNGGCCVRFFATPWTAAHQASLSFTVSLSLLRLMSMELVMPSNHLVLSSPSPAISLSQHQGLFQCVGSLHQVAKILELQLQHQSFHEYSGLAAFRIDWLDLLAVQGTLKSLLQHHSSKASIVWSSVFFRVQFSRLLEKPYLWVYELCRQRKVTTPIGSLL